VTGQEGVRVMIADSAGIQESMRKHQCLSFFTTKSATRNRARVMAQLGDGNETSGDSAVSEQDRGIIEGRVFALFEGVEERRTERRFISRKRKAFPCWKRLCSSTHNRF
jgi:hypothetical protein